VPIPTSKELAVISEELNRRSIELSLQTDVILTRLQELKEMLRRMKEERGAIGD